MDWPLVNFIHKVPLAPSNCLSKWIKLDKWDYFQNGSQDFIFQFSISISIYLFKYETIVRSSAWSFGHSYPDPSSVNTEVNNRIIKIIFGPQPR